MDFKDYFILFFFAIAIGFFFWGIFSAIYWTKREDPGSMPKILRHFVTGSSGVLAANVGALLGIKIEEAITGNINLITNVFTIPADTTVLLQMITAVLYGIAMLIAFIAWGSKKFTEDPQKVVVILPQLSQSLIGILLGVIAIVIGS